MVIKLTASQENYLELILGLSKDGPVRISDIARTAGVKLPSVTKAVTRLADAGLVRHESYGTVEITPAGQEAARSVVRRDDCLSRLLTEILGLPEDAAAEEVCRLEHVISHDVLLRLETLVEHATAPRSRRWLENLLTKLSNVSPEKNEILVGKDNPHVVLEREQRKKRKGP